VSTDPVPDRPGTAEHEAFLSTPRLTVCAFESAARWPSCVMLAGVILQQYKNLNPSAMTAGSGRRRWYWLRSGIWALTMQCDRHGRTCTSTRTAHSHRSRPVPGEEAWRICGYDSSSSSLTAAVETRDQPPGLLFYAAEDRAGTARVPNNKRNSIGAQAVMDY
jgi:hypothetical protein